MGFMRVRILNRVQFLWAKLILRILRVCNFCCKRGDAKLFPHFSQEVASDKICPFRLRAHWKMHAHTIAQAPGAQLTVVYDPISSAAEAVASELGCRVAKNVEEAISAADAVLIATSTSTHADLIERSAKAGMAVFSEKPDRLELGPGSFMPRFDSPTECPDTDRLQPTV
jgi:hypothetical protein